LGVDFGHVRLGSTPGREKGVPDRLSLTARQKNCGADFINYKIQQRRKRSNTQTKNEKAKKTNKTNHKKQKKLDPATPT